LKNIRDGKYCIRSATKEMEESKTLEESKLYNDLYDDKTGEGMDVREKEG